MAGTIIHDGVFDSCTSANVHMITSAHIAFLLCIDSHDCQQRNEYKCQSFH